MTARMWAARSCFVSILLFGPFLFLLTMPAGAQLPTGTFLGVVKDTSGAVVPGATVTIQSSETNETRNAVTDSSGAYRVPALSVGHYQIKVEHGGFKTETQTGLNLEVGQEAVIDFTLQVGTTEQQVQVTGEAQQVNTTNSTLGSVVSEQTMADLPLNGRNYNDLTLLQPGITQNKTLTNSGGQQPGVLFSSNGAPVASNSITLDGASMLSVYAVSAASGTGNTLGVDGIREYKVVTNNFSAEYGMTMGSQIVLVSKSGTNSFHGDGFEFIRNDVLDAANYFDKAVQANHFERTPPFKRNQFGGALGGPVQKDKTFFFAAYEGLREDIGQTLVTTTVPATCFVATNNPCTSPAGGTVNPASYQILQLFPTPNLPNNQYTYPFSEPITENWGEGRIDHTFSQADTAFVRYTFDGSYFVYGLEYQPFYQSQSSRGQFVTFSENHIFSSALLNTARFSFSRTAIGVQSPSNFGPNYPSIVPGQEYPGLGTFSISGVTVSATGTGFGPSGSQPSSPNQNIFTWSDDLFWEKGKHSFKFGTLINHFQDDQFVYSSVRGSFSASSLASFLAGSLSSASLLTYPGGPRRHFRNNTFGVYAQDDYKILPNLTLNLGLRYEFATVISDRNGLDSNADPTCVYPCSQIGPLYKNPYLHNFSPRVGFAWDVFGNGKTSLRGGGALLYDVETLGSELQIALQDQPFTVSSSLGPTPFTIPIDLIGAATTAASHPTEGFAHNMKAPKMYQWNLTVEQQLPWTTALQISYVGSRGIHILQYADGNPVQFTIQNGQPFWPAAAQAVRVTNPTWGAFVNVNGWDNSYYEALEVSATKRLNHGLQFQSEYTYAKLIDNTDGSIPSQSASTSQSPITILDERLDRSLASFDVRNNYRFNTIYNLPTTSSSNHWVEGMLNGWWTAAILSLQNGYPFTPSLSTNRSRSQTNSSNPGNLDRPDWAPGRNPYNATHGGSSGCTEGTGATTTVIQAGTPLGGPSLYFDPCAFVLQPVGYEGDVGRDSVIGPGLLDLDYSLVKDTSAKWLGEAGKIQFRAEFFNILNHPNFAQPTRAIFSGSSTTACPITGCPVGTEPLLTGIGLIQSTAAGTTAVQSSGNSRQIQFGLKIAF